METCFRGFFVLHLDQSSFSLFSKPFFWHNGHTNMSSDRQQMISILHIYSINLCCGLCRALFLETLETPPNRRQINFKNVNKTSKRENGMIPKDVKPYISYPQIFYTIARKKNKQSIENKKEYIFIYQSYVYIYI